MRHPSWMACLPVTQQVLNKTPSCVVDLSVSTGNFVTGNRFQRSTIIVRIKAGVVSGTQCGTG
jgi:hypothetical protein